MKFLVFALFFALLAPGISSAQFLFKDVTGDANINMQSNGSGDVGPGAVVFDLNNDGWDDIYMPGGFYRDKLYINLHDGTFKNISDTLWTDRKPFLSTNIPDTNFAKHFINIFPRGGSAFDFDNDGLTDLYVCCQQRDILWHNNGDGTFTDMTRQANLNFPLDRNESNSSTFGDFNGDGRNDFYVSRWVNEYKFRDDGQHNLVGYAHKGFPNWFYVNNGSNSKGFFTFTDRAKEFGIDGDTGCSNIALFFDYDRDGDLDLLIGNDFGVELLPNLVFKNLLMETGEAKFVDVSKESGLERHLFNMGIGPIDFDRDGNFDFYETSIGPDELLKNNGNGRFTDVSKEMLPGFNGYERHGDYKTTTWTALMSDYDNDGWEDGFIVHGFEGGISPWLANPNEIDTCIFLHNTGSILEDYTDQAMMDDTGKSHYFAIRARGAAYLDFNNDGKLDICLAALNPNTFQTTKDFRLAKNITPNSGNSLEMRFTALRTAKEAIGTIVDVWAGGIRHSRQVSTGGGFGSQNSLMQHVGLGSHPVADSVVVYWPADKHRHRQIDRYYNVTADQMIHFTEDTSTTLSVVPAKTMETIKIYPSPARNMLHVTNLDPVLTKHFEIFDLLGIRKIDVFGSESTFSISVADLKPGYYVLRISINGGTKTSRFIKE